MATSFRLEHEFEKIPLEKFEAHLNDPELNAMLEKGLSFDQRKLMNKTTKESGVIEWSFQVKKTGDMPEAIKKVLKGNSFSWREDSKFVPSEHKIYWQIIPDLKSLKFSGVGI